MERGRGRVRPTRRTRPPVRRSTRLPGAGLLLLGADLLAVAVAFQVARAVDLPSSRSALPTPEVGALVAVATVLVAVVMVVAVLAALDAYQLRPRSSVLKDLPSLVVAALAGGLIGSPVVGGVLVLVVPLFVMLVVGRSAGYVVVHRAARHEALAPDRTARAPVAVDEPAPAAEPGPAGRRSLELQLRSRDGQLWGIPLVRLHRGAGRRGAWPLGRVLDVVLAGGALLLLAPLLAVVALALRLELGRGVTFRQVRVGVDGRPFTIVKFRCTRPLGEAGPVGRLVRSTSVDELPQLVAVLRGRMSIVGPRPGSAAGASRARRYAARV